jgi:hypothetical protein
MDQIRNSMSEKNYKIITESYFKALNERDPKSLTELYSDSVRLQDWYGTFDEIDVVLSENLKLFQKDFSITVTQILQCDNKTFAFLDLRIDQDTISVIDILEWDSEFKIKTIEAYWR